MLKRDDVTSTVSTHDHVTCRVLGSASNYLLGLSPVQLAPFVAGTLSGMAAWCFVYSTLGGAGRSLLKSGTSLDTLLSGAPDSSQTATSTGCISAEAH